VFVGIDVHKHTHAAALVDERGGELGVLTFANSPAGYRRLIGWLADRAAAEAVIIGVESPGSYGRCLTGALAAARHEVLHVPAWRTHRERRRQGPGKTDSGDALAIADVVRRKHAELGPALQPELIRAISILELQRRRFVLDRTQAIQRLRSDWTQVDPVAEAKVVHVARQRELRRLKRIRFGDGLVERIAAATVRQLALDIEDLNARITDLEAEIAALLNEHGNPVADLPGAGNQIAAALIANAGDVRRFKDAAAFARYCGTGADPLRIGTDRRAPPPPPRGQPPTQRRPLPHRDRPAAPPPRRQSLPRPKDPRRQDTPRSPPSPQTPPRQRHLPPPARLGSNSPGHESRLT
jgi:transposase